MRSSLKTKKMSHPKAFKLQRYNSVYFHLGPKTNLRDSKEDEKNAKN